ncbi:MAG: DEAD/DEAH box helicase [Rhodanobacteraceae bacterium]|nr:MAG: DEAD/DEAH box helicase [Rhodanobacteraceae bacterium]
MTLPVSTPRSAPAATDSGDFASLHLAPAIQRVLADVGYETPSPIQAATIPPLLAGRDVLGQAQTGTGKTAAFALPILSRLDAKAGAPQALVLAPTRELAIQVAEAFQTYAAHIPGFRVLPIYGGQGYGPQLSGLRRGVHVVVGTPGRTLDHIRKGSLDLSGVRFAVLDEADEMLNMGFTEDVDAILAATPGTRQTALFSATMPAAIRRIARAHMRDPVEITIESKTTTAANTRQRYWMVSGMHKLDALTRILEAEAFDAMLIFARTRQATETLAEKLQARGFTAAAIHGDIAQPQRERLVKQLRDGALDILVATDVAARGLDVGRISHVLNYDIPYDVESYVHRIGRTGRAGHKGEAIVFVSPRERGMLRAIERATRQPLEAMELPSVDVVNDHRIQRFLGRIDAALAGDDLTAFRQIIERYEREHDTPAIEIAAALARLAHGDKPLLLKEPVRDKTEPAVRERTGRRDTRAVRERAPRAAGGNHPGAAPRKPYERKLRAERPHEGEAGKQTYRIEVGHAHGAQPKNIIGAIANEGDIDSRYIGRLTIRDDYSLIDLPEGMPSALLARLKKVRVAGRQLCMRLETGAASATPAHVVHARPRTAAGRDDSGHGGFKPPRRPR